MQHVPAIYIAHFRADPREPRLNLKTLLAPAPVFGLMLILGFPPAPLLAQQELNAVLNQTNQLFGAGNYDAALIQAQKLEAGVKTRGANHPTTRSRSISCSAYTRR
jgi:hypothetical protein